MKIEKERVLALLQKVIKSDQALTPDKNLRDDLEMVSIQMMEFIALIEKEFDIIIPVNNVINIRTIQDLLDAIDNIDQFIKN